MVSKMLAGILFPAFFVFFTVFSLYGDILKDVRAQKIGIDGFYIGDVLNEITNLKKIKGSYRGTERFLYGDFVITVSKKERVILGIYKKVDNATFSQLKKTVSFLMMSFGEPTVEAHGKTIYWFYSKKGKISQEEFSKQRKTGKIQKPLIMVKFHSTSFISSKIDEPVSFYFIIYSEPLMRKLLR